MDLFRLLILSPPVSGWPFSSLRLLRGVPSLSSTMLARVEEKKRAFQAPGVKVVDGASI